MNIGDRVQFVAGPAVVGEAFFGRRAELTRIHDRISAGMSTLIVGHRRMGKTSLLLHLRWQNSKEAASRAMFLFMDGETLSEDGPSEFLTALVSSISDRLDNDQRSVRSILRRPPVAGWTIPAVQSALERITSSRGPIILLLDETDYMVSKFPRAAMQLRSLISSRLICAVCSAFHWPDQFEPTIGASVWSNVFTLDALGMFSMSEAEEMLERLSTNCGNRLESHESAFLIEVFGPHPFRLQTAGVALFESRQFTSARSPAMRRLFLADAVREATSRLERHLLYDIQHLSSEEIKVLREISNGLPVSSSNVLDRLRLQGIVHAADVHWTITSTVFAQLVAQIPRETAFEKVRSSAAWEFLAGLGKKAFNVAVDKAIDAATRHWLPQ